jgi:flagellar assembly protein FliH
MILRDAIVSEQRRQIGRPPREPLPVVGAKEREPNYSQAVDVQRKDESALAPLSVAVREPLLPAQQPTPESRMTFEGVAAWLAVQDAETRVACASLLADELTQVHESAQAAGLAAGRAQGLDEGRESAGQLLDTLRNVSESAAASFAQEQLKLAELCVDIVAEAFRKIAGALLATDEAATGAVTEVLKRVKEGRELAIRVCPADLDILQLEQDRLAAALSGRKFTLVGDPRVEIGGCIVDTKLGSLDGRLEVQLRELYETLRVLKSAPMERA